MLTCNGIAVTDEINLYNEKFSLQAMYHAYEKQWDTIFPSFANHNHKISIGYSKLTGIYIDSKMAYTTNSITIGENEEEEKRIRNVNYHLLYKTNVLDNIEQYKTLEHKLGDYIVGDKTYYWTNCVFIHNKDIVKRVFPELIKKMEKGLINLELLSPVLPGIYKMGEYLIFAHLYFRRSYSYLNTLNTPFLSHIESLDPTDKSVKIAIDLDCIGLAGTEHAEHEYSYWWGPKFNDDLKSIPLGVTRHENEHYNKLFSEFLRTEFGWYIQDDKHTFESEEITDIPNIKIDGNNMYACRFVHSMVDDVTGVPTHLDGAVRTYSDDRMIERLDISIKDSDRDTLYTKIWRIDGAIPISIWKELITHYYRDNMMIGEYFGGKDEKLEYQLQKRNDKELSETDLKDFLPCDILRGEGIKIYFSYDQQTILEDKYDIYVRTDSFIKLEKQINKFIESQTISLCKLIERKGSKVRIPFCKNIGFFDMVYNYPTFECRTTSDANVIISAIKEMCEIWHRNGDDRVVSFTIKTPLNERSGVFRFLGHVDDFCKYYENKFDYIPDDANVYNWLAKSYKFLCDTFSTFEKDTHPFDIINSCGNLSIKRNFVPAKKIKSWNEDGSTTLLLTKEEVEVIKKKRITAVVAFINEETHCSKCGKIYQNCKCISLIDKNVFEEIKSCKLIGATWTNRSAFL
ncbi:MAG: hypothetical protein IKK77_04950 [Clostridia bacterium]|nr:hypothetical protein [Clostridia bacterium]